MIKELTQEEFWAKYDELRSKGMNLAAVLGCGGTVFYSVTDQGIHTENEWVLTPHCDLSSVQWNSEDMYFAIRLAGQNVSHKVSFYTIHGL